MELITKNKMYNKIHQKIELYGTWLRKVDHESGEVQVHNFQQALKQLTTTASTAADSTATDSNNGSECKINDLGLTVLEWETDSKIHWSSGTLGFTVYDVNSSIVFQSIPSFAGVDTSGCIAVNNIELIKFETNTEDGFLGLINVKEKGVNQQFHCIDCLSYSSSTQLFRIYLDMDILGPEGLAETAYCQNACFFKKGAPPSNSFTVYNDSLLNDSLL